MQHQSLKKALYITSILLFFFNIITPQNCYAQNDTFFVATKNDSLFFNKEFQQIEERYKNHIDAIKGDYKKEYKEIFKERFDNIKYHFTEKKLFTNTQAQDYLKRLLNEIIKSNPQLQGLDINIFFNKTEIPNATFVGENTILFNTGLFHRLQNESQVVFVLCHELSHFYLDHSNKHIEKYITTVYSKEFQKELKSIKNAEYKKREQIERLALGLKFDTRKHSRYKESEADSMAIVFMSKTMFDAQEAINLLGILDTLDKDSFDAENCLKTTFQSVEYPFKNNWLEKEEGLLGGHANIKEDEKLADSLKTHPDCKVRIEFVKKLLLQYTQNNAQKSFINPQYFNVLQNTLPLENLAYFYEKKYYSTAFYQCLKQLQQQPNSPYLVTTIGNLYNGFYDAQKQHHLNRVATLPYPGNSNSFNLTLQFIQNVNLEDYKNINVNFLKKYETKLSKFPAFSNTLAQAKKS